MRSTGRPPLVGTIILNYQDVDDTLEAVAAVQRSTTLDQVVMVVDNAEDPAPQQELAARLPSTVEYVATGSNLGYAAGNNIGIERLMARGVQYLWVLNPDVRVRPDTLAGLLATAEQVPDAGIVGARLTNGDSSPTTILFDGGFVDHERGGATWHLNQGKPMHKTPAQGIVEVDYVTGACMLVDCRLVEEIGGIPEDYFLYFEETDFCLRARRAGWHPVVNQDVVAAHHKRSSGALPSVYYLYYMTRNRAIFAARHSETGTDAIDVAYADLDRSFLVPWRARVAERAPSWLETYDQIVARAKQDGRAGIVGPSPAVSTFDGPR